MTSLLSKCLANLSDYFVASLKSIIMGRPESKMRPGRLQTHYGRIDYCYLFVEKNHNKIGVSISWELG